MVNTIKDASQTTTANSNIRVTWLMQGAGHYWQPILSEFTRLLPNSKVLTANWPGFLPGFENSFAVKQVGEIKVLSANKNAKGYAPSITFLPPTVLVPLLQSKPDVVFSVGFTIWSILALIFKLIGRWRTVIVYDGSSPGVDYQGSKLRMWVRRFIAKYTDAFITNNQAGKAYLTDIIKAEKKRVFARPYLVPHPKTYLPHTETPQLPSVNLQKPVFIFVGYLIPRKGLQELLQACVILKEQGYQDYTLLVIGNGVQSSELEAFAVTHQIENQVHWLGRVEYEHVGAYFQKADVFVFPTLEDVWGLVAVEAMMFGKPILCSKWAGAVELVNDGENGYVFEPRESEKLAELMSRFIKDPNLIKSMGEKSKQIMSDHTPEDVAKFLTEVVDFVLEDGQ